MHKMFWIDLETSGLNPRTEIVMEVGCMVTDQWGQELDWFDTLIKYDPKQYNWDVSADPFVKKMHANSGLFQSVINKKEGAIEHHAWEALDHFVVTNGISKHPMCGSSVQFDRSFMEWHAPDPLVERFHYRNIDITSIIETMKIVNPDLYVKMDADVPSREMHRVRPDLEDTVSRYRWMLDGYLRIKDLAW
jgi:oligoribonuclease